MDRFLETIAHLFWNCKSAYGGKANFWAAAGTAPWNRFCFPPPPVLLKLFLLVLTFLTVFSKILILEDAINFQKFMIFQEFWLFKKLWKNFLQFFWNFSKICRNFLKFSTYFKNFSIFTSFFKIVLKIVILFSFLKIFL